MNRSLPSQDPAPGRPPAQRVVSAPGYPEAALLEGWTLDGAPPLVCRPITAEALPEAARPLLDHAQSMTQTLADHHGEAMGIRVSANQRSGEVYWRKIVMETATTQAPVETALIRIDLAPFAPAVRTALLEEDLPFGRVLDLHGVPYSGQVMCFLEIDATPDLRRSLSTADRPAPGPVLFGRQNRIVAPSGQGLADVIEILAPVL